MTLYMNNNFVKGYKLYYFDGMNGNRFSALDRFAIPGCAIIFRCGKAMRR